MGRLGYRLIKMKKDIYKELESRVLVLDGAMGTMIQKHRLTEADFQIGRAHV